MGNNFKRNHKNYRIHVKLDTINHNVIFSKRYLVIYYSIQYTSD